MPLHWWLLALAALFRAGSAVEKTASGSARAPNHRYSNDSVVEILSPRGPATYLSTKNVSDEVPLDVIFIINKNSQEANSTHAAIELKKSMNVTGGAAAEQRLFWHHQHPPNNCPNHPFPPSGPYLPPPLPPAVPCGGIFASQVSVLVNPNHPGPYPMNAKCVYKVKTPLLIPTCLRVSVAHLAIRWTPNCVQDWIQIGESQPRLCGGLVGEKYFRVEGGFFPVIFHSGRLPGPPDSGFKIVISQIPCQILQPPRPPPRPPIHHPRPPGPPIPPGHYPPPHKPIPYKWRWLWLLKCEWGGIENLPPGHCPPPHPPRPINRPPPGPGFPPPRDKTDPPAPPPPQQQGPLCNRATSEPEFVTVSSEWLPSLSNLGKQHWSCRLTVYKAHPDACELQLNLERLELDCRHEWIEVDGQRICGEQPLRQLSVDFRGPEARIDYRNMGTKRPGTFLVRGQQSFECNPLNLGVTPVKKLAAATPPTPGNYISRPIAQNQPWRKK
ncbi:actin-binding protein WASF1-like [Neocloeon triangulifer]|uniref:actin-binding protein WASF1-like n=1 Tax=Neocloeon triangulifer TaxID=2078957 RepID=UPI00286F1AD7|nr:actin-binding protein WASF1-like [Neocloeon triangulifer]